MLKISKVLVVEDEAMISMLLEDMLIELGMQVCGPAGNLAHAERLLETDNFDAALLDANLSGESVLPFAEKLVHKNIPFAFTTGYGAAISDNFPRVPVLQKPYTQEQIEDILLKLAV